MTLGTKLRQLREKKRFSQQEVADALNVSQSTYCQWESDQKTFRIDYLVKLARLFEVSYNELLLEENTSGPVSVCISEDTDLSAEDTVQPTLSSDIFLDLLNSKNEIIRLLTLENQRLLFKKDKLS